MDIGRENIIHEPPRLTPNLEFLANVWRDPTSYFPYHWHDALEIIFVSEGTGFVSIHGKEHRIDAGKFVLINSWNVHSTWTHDDYVFCCNSPMRF